MITYAAHPRWLILPVAALMLAACVSSTPPAPAQTTVQVDGKNYQVEELTASTWTVTAPPALAQGPGRTAALVRAIEVASHCKVTDTDYTPDRAVMNAQVDCRTRLKN